MRACALALTLALCSGCYAHDELDRNAPGDADLEVPPAGRLAMPHDPGLQGVLLSGGIFGGGGPELGGQTPHAVTTGGVELSAAYYRSDIGVFDPDHLPPLDGVNLGLTLFGPERADDALYLELEHVDRLAGVAAGWSWNPLSNANGPQATFFYGPLYARVGYALGLGGELQFGLFLKGYERLSWFR